MTPQVDYLQITVTYTIPGSITWYTQSSGGTIVQTGATLNPIGDAEVIARGGIYANLGNTNTPGTYRFFAECSSTPGCRAATDFVINAASTVTNPGNIIVDDGDLVTVTFSGTATTYNWTNSNTAIGLGASGTGDLSFTATNLGASSIAATIWVTPSSGTCTEHLYSLQ